MNGDKGDQNMRMRKASVILCAFTTAWAFCEAATTVESYLQRGEKNLQDKRYDLALADFSEAIRLDPQCKAAYIGRGKTYCEKTRADWGANLNVPRKAVADFSRAIELDPQCIEAIKYRIQAWELQVGGFTSSATESVADIVRADCVRAIELNPKCSWAYKYLGLVFAKSKDDTNTAIKHYSKAIELGYDCYDLRGDAYQEAGNLKAAINDYSKAIKNNPESNIGYLDRGRLFEKMQLYDQAISDFSQAIKVAPEQDLHYSDLIGLLMRTGQHERAIPVCTQANRIHPENAYFIGDRGYCYARTENHLEAISDFTNALDLWPGYLIAQWWRALSYMQTGEFRKAEGDFSLLSLKLARDRSTIQEDYFWYDLCITIKAGLYIDWAVCCHLAGRERETIVSKLSQAQKTDKELVAKVVEAVVWNGPSKIAGSTRFYTDTDERFYRVYDFKRMALREILSEYGAELNFVTTEQAYVLKETLRKEATDAKITDHTPTNVTSQFNRSKYWALIVGISEYMHRNKSGLTNLAYADDDAHDFAQMLKKQGWSANHVKLLVNEQATYRNIMIALESWLTKCGEEDTAVLYWSGHGFPDPEDPEKVYLACYDTEMSIPATGYRMDRVTGTLKELGCRNVIVFADTCHAGRLVIRGDERAIGVTPYVRQLDRRKEIPKGWIYMVSSEADRKAVENSSWAHGAFTHCLLKALGGEADGYQSMGPRDGIVSMGEIRAYMASVMPEETQKVLGVAKHPLITTSTGDPGIWNLNMKVK